MINDKTIIKSIPLALHTVDISKLGEKHQGKVRDYYIRGSERIIITTDRQSAFDRILGLVPFKGQVLTQLSNFWFEETADIIPNHLILSPDPNVIVVKNCQLIPIEMVVRGFISGVTSTSLWTAYAKGERNIYGIDFPEGLSKNQKLETPVITPTTKAEVGHDERLTQTEIIDKKIVSENLWQQMKSTALALFKRGSEICDQAGIILVDTKYEFGLLDGQLILIDEIHTPDSSRFWVKKTYKERISKGEEPENFDKEFLRIWYKEQGYAGDGEPPAMPEHLTVDLTQRYIGIYEKITGKKFEVFKYPINNRIIKNISTYLSDR